MAHQSLKSFSRELRQAQTKVEQHLWKYLRNRRLGGRKFRIQFPIPPYILDFYWHEMHLAVELDGSQHLLKEKYDRKRTEFLENQGIQVLRFWNHDVLHRTEKVLEMIREYLWSASFSPLIRPSDTFSLKGEGFPSLFETVDSATSGRDALRAEWQVGSDGNRFPGVSNRMVILWLNAAYLCKSGNPVRAQEPCPSFQRGLNHSGFAFHSRKGADLLQI